MEEALLFSCMKAKKELKIVQLHLISIQSTYMFLAGYSEINDSHALFCMRCFACSVIKTLTSIVRGSLIHHMLSRSRTRSSSIAYVLHSIFSLSGAFEIPDFLSAIHFLRTVPSNTEVFLRSL